jgi:hypothetical protein
VQHRFHRWGKKSKITTVCFGGHVEAMKFCDDHVVNSLLTFFPEFQAEHFEKSLPSGNLGARTRVFVILFAWKSEHSGGRKLNTAMLFMSNGLCLWAGTLPTGQTIVSL